MRNAAAGLRRLPAGPVAGSHGRAACRADRANGGRATADGPIAPNDRPGHGPAPGEGTARGRRKPCSSFLGENP
jgi:hypothetical protein